MAIAATAANIIIDNERVISERVRERDGGRKGERRDWLERVCVWV
jgi:hypothetical protein